MSKKNSNAHFPAHTNQASGLEKLSRKEGDPQELRALELEAAGFTVHAQRVRECGLRDGIRAIRTCKIRGCIRCSAMMRAKTLPWIQASLERMERPRVGVINMLSKTKKDLAKTFDLLHESLIELRRARRRLGIVRIVGAVEAVVTKDRRRWNVHVHVVMECRRSSPLKLEKFWKTATASRGHFELHEDEFVQNRGGLGNYMSKVDSWCPAPGALDPEDLATLLRALKGRHLKFRWGFAPEPRTRAPLRIVWTGRKRRERMRSATRKPRTTTEQPTISSSTRGRTEVAGRVSVKSVLSPSQTISQAPSGRPRVALQRLQPVAIKTKPRSSQMPSRARSRGGRHDHADA